LTQEELLLILEECRQNKRAAQENCIKYFYADMFRLCQRYAGDPHASLSIVNDAFLKVFKNIVHYRETLGTLNHGLKRL
jgi:RNA polymerase sigma-70 factor (ECF subfamily)